MQDRAAPPVFGEQRVGDGQPGDGGARLPRQLGHHGDPLLALRLHVRLLVGPGARDLRRGLRGALMLLLLLLILTGALMIEMLVMGGIALY